MHNTHLGPHVHSCQLVRTQVGAYYRFMKGAVATSLYSMQKERENEYIKEMFSCGALVNCNGKISRDIAIPFSFRKLLYTAIWLSIRSICTRCISL